MHCRATRPRRWTPAATPTWPSRSVRARSSLWCRNSCRRSNRDKRLRTPPRILAVDDVPENLELARLRLQPTGVDVVTAPAGEEALERASEVERDLSRLDGSLREGARAQ